ncbi:MAG: carboxy-S-adenosyl-L-methionine synthase CmoA [Gammaproteobacteria bacterium]|nr:carboxy-S-adenosyl-L-methionine synthase CmoA [Gammaproteobacteria bacterium]
MKHKDTLFATPMETSPFEFNAQVADVFDNMIQRSVPGYHFLLDVIAVLAQRYGAKDSQCYDLGCSLGTTSLRLRQNLPASCHVIGVDNSAAMVSRCKHNMARDHSQASYEICQQNIQDTRINNASIVILNFTLQFIDDQERQTILDNIYAGMNPGGVLLLAEKVCFDASEQQQLQTTLYHDFKRLQGYSDLEVAQKRAALENVLVPNTLQQHRQRLHTAGFKQTEVCMQCFNFAALLAFK